MSLLLLALLAGPAAAADVGGGHEAAAVTTAGAAVQADSRRVLLEEMCQRRILPPDQKMWSPDDYELLERIRRAEDDALTLLKRRGGYRAWTAKPRPGAALGAPRLTKEGYERYLFLLTQDAIDYFESKGADAKWVFKLKDWEGRSLFDARGSITEAGAAVYRRAGLNLEVFWRSPDGAVFGTRKPPK